MIHYERIHIKFFTYKRAFWLKSYKIESFETPTPPPNQNNSIFEGLTIQYSGINRIFWNCVYRTQHLGILHHHNPPPSLQLKECLWLSTIWSQDKYLLQENKGSIQSPSHRMLPKVIGLSVLIRQSLWWGHIFLNICV